jgi:molybdate transport system ATP-binding protein
MNLTFECQHRYASGFSLDVKFQTHAPITALIGPSGSGKTTVLKLIAGLSKPSTGYIGIGEHVLTDTKHRVFTPPELRHVGLLFQDHCLFPHLTVRANLEYGLRRRTSGSPTLDHVVEILELADFVDRMPRTLSGGQMQRVALGRAILCAPRLLLLDEPLTAVEAELRDRIVGYIQTIVREYQIPVLLVSHNRALVDDVATEVIGIRDGQLDSLTTGTPS